MQESENPYHLRLNVGELVYSMRQDGTFRSRNTPLVWSTGSYALLHSGVTRKDELAFIYEARNRAFRTIGRCVNEINTYYLGQPHTAFTANTCVIKLNPGVLVANRFHDCHLELHRGTVDPGTKVMMTDGYFGIQRYGNVLSPNFNSSPDNLHQVILVNDFATRSMPIHENRDKGSLVMSVRRRGNEMVREVYGMASSVYGNCSVVVPFSKLLQKLFGDSLESVDSGFASAFN